MLRYVRRLLGTFTEKLQTGSRIILNPNYNCYDTSFPAEPKLGLGTLGESIRAEALLLPVFFSFAATLSFSFFISRKVFRRFNSVKTAASK